MAQVHLSFHAITLASGVFGYENSFVIYRSVIDIFVVSLTPHSSLLFHRTLKQNSNLDKPAYLFPPCCHPGLCLLFKNKII